MPSNLAQLAEDGDLTVDMLSQYAYCPRRFHLMYVQGRWDDNTFTEQGKSAHRRVDQLDHVLPDPDAPQPTLWVHWLIYRIGADYPYLPAGIDPVPLPELPPGARQGANSANTIGYRGPALPPGHGVHRYRFRLYALDVEADLPPGLSKDELMEAAWGHIRDEGELIGTYQ